MGDPRQLDGFFHGNIHQWMIWEPKMLSWRRPEKLLGQLTHSCSAYRCYTCIYIYICVYIYVYTYMMLYLHWSWSRSINVNTYHCSLRTTMDYSTIFYQYGNTYYYVLYNYVQYLTSQYSIMIYSMVLWHHTVITHINIAYLRL